MFKTNDGHGLSNMISMEGGSKQRPNLREWHTSNWSDLLAEFQQVANYRDSRQ